MTREEAIDLLDNLIGMIEDNHNSDYDTAFRMAIKALEQEPKTGHWEQYGYPWEDRFKCSECGEKQPKILCGERIIEYWSDYCPNCGARMTEGSDTK